MSSQYTFPALQVDLSSYNLDGPLSKEDLGIFPDAYMTTEYKDACSSDGVTYTAIAPTRVVNLAPYYNRASTTPPRPTNPPPRPTTPPPPPTSRYTPPDSNPNSDAEQRQAASLQAVPIGAPKPSLTVGISQPVAAMAGSTAPRQTRTPAVLRPTDAGFKKARKPYTRTKPLKERGPQAASIGAGFVVHTTESMQQPGDAPYLETFQRHRKNFKKSETLAAERKWAEKLAQGRT